MTGASGAAGSGQGRTRPFWHRQAGHEHHWAVMAEHYTSPGGEVGQMKVRGYGPEAHQAVQRHYDTLDQVRLGATTLVYECVCGLRRTDTLIGDARTPDRSTP